MIISLDTEIMLQMASLAASSFEEVNQCADTANRITAHNDWNCKERDVINDSVAQTKVKIHRLYENIEHLSNALSQVATRFQDSENEYIQMFGRLDCSIGSMLSVAPAAASISPAMGSAASYVRESSALPHGMESYSVGSLAEPIQMCNFSDVYPKNGR